MLEHPLRDDWDKAKRIAKVMKYLGNPTRLAMVQLLIEKGPMTVKAIYESMGISQSNASQHLRSLEQAEILMARREGSHIYYSIAKIGLPRIIQCAYDTVRDAKEG